MRPQLSVNRPEREIGESGKTFDPLDFLIEALEDNDEDEALDLLLEAMDEVE